MQVFDGSNKQVSASGRTQTYWEKAVEIGPVSLPMDYSILVTPHEDTSVDEKWPSWPVESNVGNNVANMNYRDSLDRNKMPYCEVGN